ncbi:MAG: adenine deaminase [gamma proteobacterium symbiont of Phacoides pectinatus]
MTKALGEGQVHANYVALDQRRVFQARITWRAGVIQSITECGPEAADLGYLIPGFIDAHVHIESAMLPPAEFGRLALCHDTIACVGDPHEIANVLGAGGVEYMLENARRSPFKAFFGAPSCVPATPYESTGGRLDGTQIEALFDHPEIRCLSEMMNFPGVLAKDPGVMAKLALASERCYPIDGHAPGLRGEQAAAYAAADITTDHECTTLDEARDFDALHPLITEATGRVMLCSDDKHPDDLLGGHINRLAARAVALGHSPFDLLRVACLNPIDHYRLPLGRLRVGDPMDTQLVSDLRQFTPLRVWIDCELVAEAGKSLLPVLTGPRPNHFAARPLSPRQLQIAHPGGAVRVIQARDGSLLTGERIISPLTHDAQVVADTGRDILPLAVINRYRPAPPALALVNGFGIRRGAIASSVAHDSHNIIAVGADPDDLCAAINAVIRARGGVAVAEAGSVDILPLPIAGIMSDADGATVGHHYAALSDRARALGSPLAAPFMTLSFMALLVIPALKLSDQGLFDGRTFRFTTLACDAAPVTG